MDLKFEQQRTETLRTSNAFVKTSNLIKENRQEIIKGGNGIICRDEKESTMDRIIETILVDYRWIFVCLFLLPLSLVYDIFTYFRSWIIFQINSAPMNHSGKVNKVQKQVKDWISAGKLTKMCTARPGWQTISFRRPKYKETLFKVDCNLVDIVKIDIEKKTVVVEPMVTMGQLTARLEPYGWTIPVLPELDDLTVGGLVMGTGIETSSHKYGLFQNICISFELVLATGEVVKCNEEENSDIFYSVPWSYGTIGFLTAVEIQIIPANRFVKLDYYPAQSLEEMLQIFENETLKKDDNQFVECLMFAKNKGVVMTGNMVTSAEPLKVNRIGRWYKPWFFKHVESFLRSGPGTEYIPLRDYFHRHSRSIFWEIQEIIPFGNNLFFRYFLGWMTPPKVSLLKLTQPESIKKLYETHHMIQDMLVPLSKLQDSLQIFHEQTQIYPLWLCPFKLINNPGMLHRPDIESEEMYVDIGAYGVPKVPHFQAEKTTRTIESFVRRNRGFQMLYADTYMTREEFRAMFDHRLYDRTRAKYSCNVAFPEVYDKVSRAARI